MERVSQKSWIVGVVTFLALVVLGAFCGLAFSYSAILGRSDVPQSVVALSVVIGASVGMVVNAMCSIAPILVSRIAKNDVIAVAVWVIAVVIVSIALWFSIIRGTPGVQVHLEYAITACIDAMLGVGLLALDSLYLQQGASTDPARTIGGTARS